MKQDLKANITIPEGTTVTLDNNTFTVKGAKGEVKRTLSNPKVKITLQSKEITLEAKKATQREKKLLRTYVAHIKNLLRGTKEGHTYKLKICSGHFPMTVAIKGNKFEIKNFIGEAKPRTLKVPEEVSVKIEGQVINVEGTDKEKTGQTAARIENLTRRSSFDKRVFQDGLYLIEKDGKPIR